MNEPASPTRPLADTLREHSGLALSLMYLLLIGVGMMYEWWLFRRFNINILYYAEAQDFLLVPFREPLVVFISALPIPLFAVYMASFAWLGRKLARGKTKQLDPQTAATYQKTMRLLKVLAPLLWSIAFTAEFADRVAGDIRAGRRQRVVVEVGAAKITGTVIGTTSQFVFLHDPAIDQTRIIVTENITEIVVAPRPKKKRG